MYVDDTTVIYSTDDIEKLCNDLNEELANISEWMRNNKLTKGKGIRYETGSFTAPQRQAEAGICC